jgi:hypothetical protein
MEIVMTRTFAPTTELLAGITSAVHEAGELILARPTPEPTGTLAEFLARPRGRRHRPTRTRRAVGRVATRCRVGRRVRALVTDVLGAPWSAGRDSFLVAPPALHAPLLELLATGA